jgi:cystathionine beta-lyase/cystathionine gamma-synthase
MVDATFATPILLRPLEHGATLVLHSATKALAGHGDVLAGVLSTNDETWLASLRQVRLLTGSVLHPMAAYLLHRGLATLALRVERAQANATELAARLGAHEGVAAVHYPGLGDTDPRGVLGRELLGPGGTLAFELATDDADAPARFLAALALITPAVSLGSTDTLIQHPASLTHRVVQDDVRRAHGITPTLMRLSVGVEHVDDIWRDLQRGLDAAEGVHASAAAAALAGA